MIYFYTFKPESKYTNNLRKRFSKILVGGMMDQYHRFCELSEAIDWISLEEGITKLLNDQHQAQWRLVSGSIYLKSFYDLTPDDIIQRWSKCPYLRFFCTGKMAAECNGEFPLSLEVLEQLSLDLEGQGYEAMIKALRDFKMLDNEQSGSSTTLH